MDNLKEVLGFDDVILVPQYSDIESRREISTSSMFAKSNNNNTSVLELDIPIVSSPMSTVTQTHMSNVINSLGGLGIIHRYNSIEAQCKMVSYINDPNKRAAAVGASGDFKERLAALSDVDLSIVCIDVAHGDHILVKKAIEYIKATYPSMTIIAGNIATSQGYRRLSEWGADFIRVSVGSGSICTTRLQTGHGIPTLQAIADCNNERNLMLSENSKCNVAHIISDGGIKNAGDIAKSLAAGADLVMLGSLLSGTKETPGTVFVQDGIKYKAYNGMASKTAQKNWKGSYSSVEGVSSKVRYKGTVTKVVNELTSNLRSAMSYSGARSIKEFKECALFVKQTSASHIEGTPHIKMRNS